MRWNTMVALIALSAVALSGCVGGDDGGDEDEAHDDECEGLEGVAHDECHSGEHTHGNETNETAEPNVPPTAALTLSGPDGAELDNTSFILVGQNITFSAANSSDIDGEVALVGLTVIDRNSTRSAQLVAAGEFVDVKMRFDTPGPVNITMRVLDDDGDGDIINTMAYVNQVVSDGAELPGADPGGIVSADDCEGPGSSEGMSLADQQYSYAGTFSVAADTRWIEAEVTSGDVEIAICSPEKEKLSDGSEEYTATDDHPDGLPPSVEYRVFAVVRSAGEFTYDVTLHFEPKPAE